MKETGGFTSHGEEYIIEIVIEEGLRVNNTCRLAEAIFANNLSLMTSMPHGQFGEGAIASAKGSGQGVMLSYCCDMG
jgi:hypothetical protein